MFNALRYLNDKIISAFENTWHWTDWRQKQSGWLLQIETKIIILWYHDDYKLSRSNRCAAKRAQKVPKQAKDTTSFEKVIFKESKEKTANC